MLLYAAQTSKTGSESGQTSQDAYREPSPEAKHRARMFSLATGAATAFFGASYILYRQLKLRAEETATIEHVSEKRIVHAIIVRVLL